MKKILLGLLFLLWFILPSNLLAADGPYIYSNDRFGLEITVPKGWKYDATEEMSKQARKNANETIDQMVSDKNLSEEQKKEIQAGAELSGALITISSKQSAFPIVQLTYSDHSENPDIKSEEDEARNFLLIFKRNSGAEIVQLPQEITINGKKGSYAIYDNVYEANGKKAPLRSYMRVFFSGNYSIVLITMEPVELANSQNETKVKEIIDSLKIR